MNAGVKNTYSSFGKIRWGEILIWGFNMWW
jgi:hypothetical protein